MEWKGDRPPLPNMEFLDQRMDAAWGRGKFRDEVVEVVVDIVAVFLSVVASSIDFLCADK